MAGYKCLSYGCRADNDAAMHKLFVDLQTTVNRFASAVKIEPIKVDGIIGKGTTEATLIVLLYIAETDKGVVGSSAAGWEAGIASPDQLAANARGVLDTLILATRQSAVAATTTPPAAPPAGTGTKPGPSVTEVATTTANAPSKPTDQAAKQKLETVRQKKPVLAASLIDRIPPWASYVGGAVLILGAIGLVMRRRGGGSSRASAPASAPASTAPTVAGPWWEGEFTSDPGPEVERIYRKSSRFTADKIKEVSSSRRAAMEWLEQVGSWPSSDSSIRKITAAAERRLARSY